MKRAVFLGIALLSVCVFLPLHCSAETPTKTPREVGINLSNIAFYTPEVVFVDVFKQSQPWSSQLPGKPYGQGGPLSIDARGWIEKLNGNGHYAETLMFVDLDGHYFAGDYVCIFDGEGTIEFAQAAAVIERKPGRLVVKVTPKNGPISLRLTKSDPKNPVRNIRLLLPGFEKTYQEQPFHPDFLKRWDGFQVIRFMDWGMTNNSKVSKWAERSTPEQATQGTEKGVALEHQIQLANALKADPWFCIPHKADDDYVREFTKLVKASLSKERKIYVEYSNECWHPGFDGGRYCAERGKVLGLSINDDESQLRYYSQRSVEVFKLVEEALGGKERLVCVLSTQPSNAWAVGIVLDWNNAGKSVDAVAVAPYFGGIFGKPASVEKTLAMSVDQLLDACQKEIEANSKHTQTIAKLVKDRGLKLLAYEGGQHLVGVEGAENNEKLMKLFHAANRDPRMKDLYLQDLRGWEEAGGGLYCVFGSMTRLSKWGSWGVLEFSDQDEKTAPKLQAIREFMRK